MKKRYAFRIIFLVFLYFNSVIVFSQSGIIDQIEVNRSNSSSPSKVAEIKNFNIDSYIVRACVDDRVTITLSKSGNFRLISDSPVYRTTQGGNIFWNIQISEIFPGATIVDLDSNREVASIYFESPKQKDPVSLVWNIGNNDTLGFCVRTPFTFPTGISYFASGRSTETNIIPGFFYEVNGTYFSDINTVTLKNGDVIRLCKPKSIHADYYPDCSEQTIDTLFSQKVVVKMIDTKGKLTEAKDIVGKYELCAGDTLRASVFYSLCVGTYLKEGTDYNTIFWIKPVSAFYHPYKIASITTPGTYYMRETPSSKCYAVFQNYNCPYTSGDLVVVDRKECDDKRIFGKIYADENQTGKFEIGEKGFSAVKLRISDLVNDTAIDYVFTDPSGSYEYFPGPSFPEGYKISIADKAFAAGQGYKNQLKDFNRLDIATRRIVKNVKVTLGAGRARPGFEVPIRLVISNLDTFTIRKYQIKLILDDRLKEITFTSPEGASISNNEVTWNKEFLYTGQDLMFTVFAKIDASVPLGTFIKIRGEFIPVPLDFDTTDNKQETYVLVSGSFDPNEKLVKTDSKYQGFVQENTKMDYTIHFQNVGTDTAFTVVVKDKLPESLDFGTFEMKGASHPYRLSKFHDTLVWTFLNILLPDNKTNEPGSQGYLTFQIQPKASTSSGTLIQNKAAIYFDYNQPVVTNTTSLTFGLPTVTGYSMNESGTSQLKIYPNPTKDMLGIESLEPGKIELKDLRGQVIKIINIESGSQSVDITDCPIGTYLLQFSSKNSLVSIKLLILK